MNKLLIGIVALIAVTSTVSYVAFAWEDPPRPFIEELPRNNNIALPVPTLEVIDGKLVPVQAPYIFDDGTEKDPLFIWTATAPDGCNIVTVYWSQDVEDDAKERGGEGVKSTHTSGLRICL